MVFRRQPYAVYARPHQSVGGNGYGVRMRCLLRSMLLRYNDPEAEARHQIASDSRGALPQSLRCSRCCSRAAWTLPARRCHAWHYHPGPTLVTVKEGEITFTHADCGGRTYRAGQSFVEGQLGVVGRRAVLAPDPDCRAPVTCRIRLASRNCVPRRTHIDRVSLGCSSTRATSATNLGETVPAVSYSAVLRPFRAAMIREA